MRFELHVQAPITRAATPTPATPPHTHSCGWEGGASAQPASGSPRAHPEHARFALSTRGTGPVLAYASAAPAAVEVAGGARVAFKHEPASGALRWEVPPGLPLDLDWALLF